ncbi:AMP-binding protein [Streptomyces sp. B1866]|uniref:AMP-binding protein n=1 Tax=Streptomyces sp. B1866 TaxID=3075431 RepID=UPI00288D06E4|nr:AMP-binding protein [Streptomyces sp. B1866]MDT3400258.1 AMP-binding protein [Streptomyces sp. B1866]
MPRPASLADALMERAARCGGSPAVAVPGEGDGGAERRVAYAELDARARAVAAWLRTHSAPGRRAMIAMDCGPHAATALLGCLYAGVVAVPVPAPAPSRTAAERTAAIAKDAGVDLVLTENAHATETSRRLSLAGRCPTCLAVDGLRSGRAAEGPRQPPRVTADSLAMLAYDSGPATAPRGAALTHGNLLAAMAALRQALGSGPRSRIGGWRPRHHALGLVGQVLHPLWLGATAVLLPARQLGEPAAWLRAVGRHRVTETAAGDSFYARCAAELTDDQLAGVDLSAWRTALNAGEPVSAATMAAFARRCAAAGLRPGTLVAGYAPAEAAPVLTAAGRPAAGTELRVVDPLTHGGLPDGAEGEIWMRGPAVATGHWGRPLDTAHLFAARTADGAAGYLRTGDLGVARGGGVLATGRVRDTLLVEGVAVHPQDVERELLHCGRPLGSARVFCAGPGAGQLVVVQEVRTAGAPRAGLPGLAAAVRARVAAEFGARTGAVLLVRPGTVRRGDRGKVGRSALREQFLRGEVRALHAEFAPGLSDIPLYGGAA